MSTYLSRGRLSVAARSVSSLLAVTALIGCGGGGSGGNTESTVASSTEPGRSATTAVNSTPLLTCDLWDWPCYVFGDGTYTSERSLQPRLFLFDVGFAARPFRACQQCEFRLGAENTADFQARYVQNLWYVSLRYIF